MQQATVHLTLAFLGEVPEAKLDRLLATAQAIRADSFELSLDRLGYWNHNRLLWAGCSSPPAALLDLVHRLQQALTAEGFAIADAKRSFTPHVTLVRKLPDIAAQALPSIEPVSWPASSFVLVRSDLSVAGPAYESIAEFSFTA